MHKHNKMYLSFIDITHPGRSRAFRNFTINVSSTIRLLISSNIIAARFAHDNNKIYWIKRHKEIFKKDCKIVITTQQNNLIYMLQTHLNLLFLFSTRETGGGVQTAERSGVVLVRWRDGEAWNVEGGRENRKETHSTHAHAHTHSHFDSWQFLNL